MSKTAIEVDNVSMKFNLSREKVDSLKIIYLKNLFVKGEIEFHFSRSARNRRTQKKPTPATVKPLRIK